MYVVWTARYLACQRLSAGVKVLRVFVHLCATSGRQIRQISNVIAPCDGCAASLQDTSSTVKTFLNSHMPDLDDFNHNELTLPGVSGRKEGNSTHARNHRG